MNPSREIDNASREEAVETEVEGRSVCHVLSYALLYATHIVINNETCKNYSSSYSYFGLSQRFEFLDKIHVALSLVWLIKFQKYKTKGQ